MRHLRYALLGLLALVALTAAVVLSDAGARRTAAQASQYVLVNIADSTDVAPGSGGATFTGFTNAVRVSDASEVAFSAAAGTSGGIYAASSKGDSRVVALVGDVAPGTGGGTFLGLDFWDLNASGHVAFRGRVSGGTASDGIFLATEAGTSDLVLQGGFAPGTPENTFDSFANVCEGLAINAGGEVAFVGDDFVGLNSFRGVYLASGGGVSAVAAGPNVRFNISPNSLNDAQTVAFWDGSLRVVPPDVIVAQGGDPAPGTGGGAFSGFGTACSATGYAPAINAPGEVAFLADVTGGSTSRGLFLASGGSMSALALIGQAAPGTGGADFAFLDAGPSLNDNGDIAFRTILSSGLQAVFTASGGTITLVALQGQAAPDTGGGSLASIGAGGNNPSMMNDKGEIAFAANVGGGDTGQGCGVDAWPADIDNFQDPMTGQFFSDISDIVIMASWFGSSLPPAPVRLDMAPNPPFGPDGFVDISDIARVAAFFGQSCTL